jgi:hypothetical protein
VSGEPAALCKNLMAADCPPCAVGENVTMKNRVLLGGSVAAPGLIAKRGLFDIAEEITSGTLPLLVTRTLSTRDEPTGTFPNATEDGTTPKKGT